MAAVKIDFAAHVKDGLNVFTSNLVPSLIALVLLCVPILGIFVVINYMGAIKAFKENGTAIDVGALLKFDNAVNHLIGVIVWGVVLSIGMALCMLPGLVFACLTYMFIPILADKPDTPWADALKTARARGRGTGSRAGADGALNAVAWPGCTDRRLKSSNSETPGSRVQS